MSVFGSTFCSVACFFCCESLSWKPGVRQWVLGSVGLPIPAGTWQEGPGQAFSTARREGGGASTRAEAARRTREGLVLLISLSVLTAGFQAR